MKLLSKLFLSLLLLTASHLCADTGIPPENLKPGELSYLLNALSLQDNPHCQKIKDNLLHIDSRMAHLNNIPYSLVEHLESCLRKIETQVPFNDSWAYTSQLLKDDPVLKEIASYDFDSALWDINAYITSTLRFLEYDFSPSSDILTTSLFSLQNTIKKYKTTIQVLNSYYNALQTTEFPENITPCERITRLSHNAITYFKNTYPEQAYLIEQAKHFIDSLENNELRTHFPATFHTARNALNHNENATCPNIPDINFKFNFELNYALKRTIEELNNNMYEEEYQQPSHYHEDL